MGRNRNDTFFRLFFSFFFFFVCSHYNCYHVSLVPAFSKCPKFALFVTKFTQDGYICHVSYSHTGCGLTFYPQHKQSHSVLDEQASSICWLDNASTCIHFVCCENLLPEYKKLKILVMSENFQSLADGGWGERVFIFVCFFVSSFLESGEVFSSAAAFYISGFLQLRPIWTPWSICLLVKGWGQEHKTSFSCHAYLCENLMERKVLISI